MNSYPLLIKSHLFFENGEFMFFSPKDSIIDQSKSTTCIAMSNGLHSHPDFHNRGKCDLPAESEEHLRAKHLCGATFIKLNICADTAQTLTMINWGLK